MIEAKIWGDFQFICKKKFLTKFQKLAFQKIFDNYKIPSTERPVFYKNRSDWVGLNF